MTNRSVSKRIRECSSKHYNYMVTIGDAEVEQGTMAVRTRGEREAAVLTFEQFREKLQKELDIFI